jgi:hypothetical protein
MVAVHRRQQQHGDGEEEPEPGQPVALGEKGNEIYAKA